MKTQLAKMVYHGIYKIIYDEAEQLLPYRIIYQANGKQKTIIKLRDFASAMFYLADIVRD